VEAAPGVNTASILVSAQINDYAMAKCGHSAEVYYRDAGIFLDSIIKVSYELGFDFVRPVYDVYNIEAEALGQRLRWDPFLMPQIDTQNPLIHDLQELEKIKTPSIPDSGRMGFALKVYELYQTHCHDKPTIIICHPFDLAISCRGYEGFVYDMMYDRERAHDYLHRLAEYVSVPWLQTLRRVLGLEKDIAYAATAWATIPNVTCEIMREFVVPYTQLLNAKCGEVLSAGMGGERFLKNPLDLLEIQRMTNPYVVSAHEPNVSAIGLATYLDFALANKMDLLIGISPGFLVEKSPVEIADKVREYISAVKCRCGLHFDLAYVPPNLPEERLRVLIETVRTARGSGLNSSG